MPKRKRSVEPAAQSSPPTCILHVPSMSDHGDFTPLRKIKGSASEKLQLLQKIRDRRLNQPHDSPCRMQSVCDQIPATLPDDLERVGYHSKCYKHFVRHFHRLGDDTEPGPSTSSWHHSPRKPGGSAEPIFPPECIFCEKVETKDAHRNTERPTTFPSFKNKENAWEQIETRAEKMGLYRLHRKVKNKDLFACEAKHHPSCFKAFRTAFYNYERAIHRAEAPKEQACMSAAHEKAFNSVLEHIQTQVIQQNKVLQLSSLRLLYVEELKLNGYENSNYRSEKLLKRLQNDPIKEHIHFTKVDHDKCDVISFWLVHSSNITVSTDSYHPESIKAQERLRRGSSEKIILAGPATRKPYDFKMFLANDDNKKQMCQLLLKVWSGQEAATRLERTEMAVLIVEGKAHQLASTNGKVEVRELPTIYSNQEETDTRVVLYLHHAATIGYKNAVVRTPDTDILLILLHHAHNIKLTVYLDTGSGKHRQLVNVSELAESLGEDYCATLLGYYVFSGEDCTSAFKGKGKVGPLKKLEKNPRFHRAFGELGDNWDANPEVERQLEKFTCVMYGQSRESSVDIVRAKLLRKMVGEDKTLTSKSKVDLARLPPCQSALKPHIQRVNHRVALYKRADQPIIEKPKPYEEQGWIRTDEGLLKPMWSSGPILPTSLVDLLNTGEHEEEEEEEGEEEFDSDDFDENDDD
uniref:uncharacterized protein n=1 Tax=Myxine glutinosa TaxID=7769 RepID=UPI00358FADE9